MHAYVQVSVRVSVCVLTSTPVRAHACECNACVRVYIRYISNAFQLLLCQNSIRNTYIHGNTFCYLFLHLSVLQSNKYNHKYFIPITFSWIYERKRTFTNIANVLGILSHQLHIARRTSYFYQLVLLLICLLAYCSISNLRL